VDAKHLGGGPPRPPRADGHAEPLGALLVERGVLGSAELDQALAAQEERGGKLGEILLDRGLVSRPLLDRALARQDGVVLETEGGFGSGLRNLIERRHLERAGVRIDAIDPDQFGGLDVDAPPQSAERRRRERRRGPDRRGGAEAPGEPDA
jgi:hypothetical protein